MNIFITPYRNCYCRLYCIELVRLCFLYLARSDNSVMPFSHQSDMASDMGSEEMTRSGRKNIQFCMVFSWVWELWELWESVRCRCDVSAIWCDVCVMACSRGSPGPEEALVGAMCAMCAIPIRVVGCQCELWELCVSCVSVYPIFSPISTRRKNRGSL